MRRLALVVLSAILLTGCARPGEFGYSPALTPEERNRAILRNWDWEGKQIIDDIDHALLLRPTGHLTLWNLR